MVTLALLWLALFEVAVASPKAPSQYVGHSECATCHSRQYAEWSGSHHDQAMQLASKDTVHGDFNNATLPHFGVISSFYMNGDRFMV